MRQPAHHLFRFHFAGTDPFDFFKKNSVDSGAGFLEYAAGVDITLTALERTTPIPLPAPALLFFAALAGLGAMQRSRRTG